VNAGAASPGPRSASMCALAASRPTTRRNRRSSALRASSSARDMVTISDTSALKCGSLRLHRLVVPVYGDRRSQAHATFGLTHARICADGAIAELILSNRSRRRLRRRDGAARAALWLEAPLAHARRCFRQLARSARLIRRCRVLALPRGASSSAIQCPARGHRVWAALRASLRDGFASLDPAPTRKDLGACEENGGR
jgi:hypothetical protein